TWKMLIKILQSRLESLQRLEFESDHFIQVSNILGTECEIHHSKLPKQLSEKPLKKRTSKKI
ncbi:14561_t:CDS:2, partial [Gigaspora rosea]